ncbi:MAG: hypothetical protein A2806_01920 [Candidatus Terrybacteria bacterium RIFCSPHIGHO2_01_FULL_48_17]|uniref:DUF5652 domain-containing protein n=1 Tax=Candidatus Terrybacteria bacterium RIFCSPHIGHO2_01_FULL_48_17 TaxID=1802362 RepID=A0A1G2PN68_9BACT|nr:MAG: hypothetical protein A2806_01920 [Candidatus Terrybacteria bacterium RIFCSPHIGHO2_01_FULL_48_17]OHA52643.1 MAG: hypothetical protein A3A30_03375 [Candidatus Terrybacteria bacterium RIFCSPLOWO2_01_FULL_48_14]
MEQFFQHNLWVLIPLMLWAIPWKGWALWRAATRNDRGWFIVLLVLQTLGVVDILYIFIFSKRKS